MYTPVEAAALCYLLRPEVNHTVLNTRVQIHVPAQLIDLLPSLRCWVRVEARIGTVPDELHAAGRGEPEDAALAVLAVPRRHDDRHCLLQHHLPEYGGNKVVYRATQASGTLRCILTQR